jgi:hypothetical protein
MLTLIRNTVLWTAGWYLFLLLIALVSGSFGLGTVELVLIPAVWLIGVIVIWWPRRSHDSGTVPQQRSEQGERRTRHE